MAARCEAAYNTAITCPSAILWHDLEAERGYLETLFKNTNAESVYGSQPNDVKEKLLIDFSEGKYNYLLTKSKIAGSGCNFQDHCFNVLFVGITYKFNDFIQAIHRVLRFGQKRQVNCHIYYTHAEYEVLKVLYSKWEKHKELVTNMINLVKA